MVLEFLDHSCRLSIIIRNHTLTSSILPILITLRHVLGQVVFSLALLLLLPIAVGLDLIIGILLNHLLLFDEIVLLLEPVHLCNLRLR